MKWEVRIFSAKLASFTVGVGSTTGWDTFQNTNYLNAEYEDLNQNFTESEKIMTRLNIKKVQENVMALDLPEESLRIIHQQLDKLSGKVDELNKFDWKSLFIGTIANLIITLALHPDIGGLLWLFIKKAFNGFPLIG